MPLRVTVELIPGGDETRSSVLNQFEIVQIERFDDDPGGMRLYDVLNQNGQLIGSVRHARSDGALALVRRALSDL